MACRAAVDRNSLGVGAIHLGPKAVPTQYSLCIQVLEGWSQESRSQNQVDLVANQSHACGLELCDSSSLLLKVQSF